MFSYSSKSTVQMAKHYRAEELSGAQQTTRGPKKQRSPRVAPASVLTSRWWVAADGMQSGLGGKHGGSAQAAW